MNPGAAVQSDEVRPPSAAGGFYPSRPVELAQMVDSLLEPPAAAPSATAPLALVSPHAGYAYSGPVAAAGYRAARAAAYDAVVIIAPSHREYFDGISVYPGRAYATPLGDVPVDEGLRHSLAAAGEPVRISRAGHGIEHAVEVQLPFILRALGPVPMLPVVMGDQHRELCDVLARRLAAAAGDRRLLIVASSDLSHYHPAAEARSIDDRFVAHLERFEDDALMRGLEEGSLEACGGGPVVAALCAARSLGGSKVEILGRADSSDAGGDPSAVVGYVSAVVRR